MIQLGILVLGGIMLDEIRVNQILFCYEDYIQLNRINSDDTWPNIHPDRMWEWLQGLEIEWENI